MDNIASCGLDCSKCPAFIATKENDDNIRKEVAQKWETDYKMDIDYKKINCVGCSNEGEKIDFCKSMCEVKKCCTEKKLNNCGECEDFSCDTLNDHYKNFPEQEIVEFAKNNLKK